MNKAAIPQDALVCTKDLPTDVQGRFTDTQLKDNGFNNDVFMLTALDTAANYILGAVSIKTELAEFFFNTDKSPSSNATKDLEAVISHLPVNVRISGFAIYNRENTMNFQAVLKKLFGLKAQQQFKVTQFIIFEKDGNFKSYQIEGDNLKESKVAIDTNRDLLRVVMKEQYLLVCNTSLVHNLKDGQSLLNKDLIKSDKLILQIPDAEIALFHSALTGKDDSDGIQEAFKAYIKALAKSTDPKKVAVHYIHRLTLVL